MGGQRLPRSWEKSVLEGTLGPRQQELSLEYPPASPYMYGVHPVKGRSQEGTKARCHPGPWGHCLWLDLQSGPEGASRGSVCFGDRALDTGRKAYFWRQDLGARAQMPHPVPPLTRAGKAVSSAWLEGRQDWPLVAGRGGWQAGVVGGWYGETTQALWSQHGVAVRELGHLLCCPRWCPSDPCGGEPCARLSTSHVSPCSS